MKFLRFILPLLFVACQNNKTLQLPEISKAPVQNVLDVSAAYVFYDSTANHGVSLNRKNLISTTNWLVNVDKRLTLAQAIPKIQFIQNKKRDAKMHKNEAAKNYFTCHDMSINNLGFIEFTNTYYHFKAFSKTDNLTTSKQHTFIDIKVASMDNIYMSIKNKDSLYKKSTTKTVVSDLEKLAALKTNNDTVSAIIRFKKSLTFQDYITLKSVLNSLKSKFILINSNEFIY